MFFRVLCKALYRENSKLRFLWHGGNEKIEMPILLVRTLDLFLFPLNINKLAYFVTLSNICGNCAIWYHLYNLKSVKNIDGGVLLLVRLQA